MMYTISMGSGGWVFGERLVFFFFFFLFAFAILFSCLVVLLFNKMCIREFMMSREYLVWLSVV